MTMMYRIFFAMLAAGGVGGALFVGWSTLFAEPRGNFWLYLGLSVLVGLLYGFVNYIFVKSVLRIFVRKFQTLEKVLVGTDPEPLPNVFLSNEIDAIEASMVRITDRFHKLQSETGVGSIKRRTTAR